MRRATSTSTIKIAVDPNGVFTYTSDGEDAKRKPLKHNQKVSWTCGDGNFAVLFNDGSPFPDVGYVGKKNGYTPDAQVGHGLPGQAFKYSVLVLRDGKGLTDDPDIVIDDGSIVRPHYRPKSTKKAAKKAAAKKAVKKQATAKKKR